MVGLAGTMSRASYRVMRGKRARLDIAQKGCRARLAREQGSHEKSDMKDCCVRSDNEGCRNNGRELER